MFGLPDVNEEIRKGITDLPKSNPDISARFNGIEGSQKMLQELMTNDDLLESIKEGSGGNITNYGEKIPQYFDKILDVTQQNGNSFKPILDTLEKNPQNVLEALESGDPNNIKKIYSEPSNDSEPLSQMDNNSPTNNPTELFVQSSDPNNPIIANLNDNELDNVILRNEVGEEMNVNQMPQEVLRVDINQTLSPSMSV